VHKNIVPEERGNLDGRLDLIFVLAGAGVLLSFVDLFVSSQVGHDGEMTTAAFDITCVR
jgi:hypothetical protein